MLWSRTAYQAGDERDHEQNDEHPEQKPRGIHGKARDAAKAHGCRNQGHHQKNDRIV